MAINDRGNGPLEKGFFALVDIFGLILSTIMVVRVLKFSVFARLCQYKDLSGTPGEGFHAIRWMGVAVVDVLGTIGLAWALHKIVGKKGFLRRLIGNSYISVLTVFFCMGYFFHWLFCVETAVNCFIEDMFSKSIFA